MEVRKGNNMGDETPQGEVNNQEDQKLVIGDQELTIDEAKELIESGKSMKQLKEQYPDIDFNEMPKAFTQSRQELAELRKLNEKPKEDLTDEDQRRKQEIKDFFANPDVQEELNRSLSKKEQALKEDLAMEKAMESLENEFNGKDGRPKFDRKKVLEHGMKQQIFNPRAAYKDLYEKELTDWNLDQRINKRRPTTYFEKRPGTGAKPPEQAKTPTNFREATAAALAENE